MTKLTPYQLFAQYMDERYPGVNYRFTSDGLLVDKEVRVDLAGGEPAIFKGMLLKYMRDGTRLKKRDGSWATERIVTAAAILDEYIKLGYIAQFAVGPEQLGQLVDSYLEDMA